MRAKTPLHGRSHGQGGSDPIELTGIQFDTDNVGGWLDITTNSADGDGYGIQLVASDDILIHANNTVTAEGDSVTISATDASGQLLLQSQQTAFLKSEKNLQIEGGINAGTTGSGVTVQATHGTLSLETNNGEATLEAGGGNTVFLQGQLVSLGGKGSIANGVAVNVVLEASTNLIVYDSGGNEIFRIDEADGSVHIKTGTTVVANL